MNKYSRTIKYCYVGYVVQAIVNNLLPLFFVIFKENYGISNDKLAALISINFVIQLVLDFAASRFGAKLGYRKSLILAHICATVGLVGICVFPQIFGNVYLGLIVATLFFAVGGGLIEVMVSPVMDGMELDENGSAMSLLHSFYCWGQVFVVALSTVFINFFGKDSWKILPLIWAIVPFLNIFPFIKAKLPPMLPESKREPMGNLIKNKVFLLLVVLMIAAGASELSISQWASYFAEKGLGVSKTVGDLLGPCLFAVLMGISRVLYGIFGEKINLRRTMFLLGILCTCSYLVAGLSKNTAISLAACAVCGFSVGLAWPGTLSIAGKKFAGGTAMFGILALAGDIGCSIGPYITGVVSGIAEQSEKLLEFGTRANFSAEQFPIKLGILSAVIFPLITVASITVWRIIDKISNRSE